MRAARPAIASSSCWWVTRRWGSPPWHVPFARPGRAKRPSAAAALAAVYVVSSQKLWCHRAIRDRKCAPAPCPNCRAAAVAVSVPVRTRRRLRVRQSLRVIAALAVCRLSPPLKATSAARSVPSPPSAEHVTNSPTGCQARFQICSSRQFVPGHWWVPLLTSAQRASTLLLLGAVDTLARGRRCQMALLTFSRFNPGYVHFLLLACECLCAHILLTHFPYVAFMIMLYGVYTHP